MHPCIHSSEPADVKVQRAQASESAVTVGSVISMEDVMIWVDTWWYMHICMDKVDKVQPTCSSQLLQLRSRSQLTPNRSLLDCFRFNGPSNRHVLWTRRLVEKRDAKCASESPLRCKKHVNSMEASNQKSAIWTIDDHWRCLEALQSIYLVW